MVKQLTWLFCENKILTLQQHLCEYGNWPVQKHILHSIIFLQSYVAPFLFRCKFPLNLMSNICSKYNYIFIFCINYNCLFNAILSELGTYVEVLENGVFLRYEVCIVQIPESCMSDSPLLVAVL